MSSPLPSRIAASGVKKAPFVSYDAMYWLEEPRDFLQRLRRAQDRRAQLSRTFLGLPGSDCRAQFTRRGRNTDNACLSCLSASAFGLHRRSEEAVAVVRHSREELPMGLDGRGRCPGSVQGATFRYPTGASSPWAGAIWGANGQVPERGRLQSDGGTLAHRGSEPSSQSCERDPALSQTCRRIVQA